MVNENQNSDTAIVKADAILGAKIGEEQLRRASLILQKYKTGKKRLEQRIIDNDKWWKIRHAEYTDNVGGASDPRPESAWLFNTIISKHADAMEAYPTFNCLPREEGDKGEAKKLSSILPVVLAQNDFEDTYSDESWQKLQSGTGCYGTFWDSSKLNGLGDIAIKKIELLNLFWQPGIKNIQESRNVFHVDLVDNEVLEQKYPHLKGKLGTSALTLSQYTHDDTIDTTDKSAVIDWYYKTEVNGKTILNYVKYVNLTVLYSSEDDPEREDKGWYAHGEYPFVLDVLFPLPDSPCGFGYIDICREPQKYIDLLGQSIMKNSLMLSSPRYFIRSDGSVNEDEYADYTKTFIHSDGNLGEDSIRQVQVTPVSDIFVTVMNNKIEELKETSGNRDVNNGGSTSGVTAASAIAAMQEQSGKTSRDSTKAAYRAYRKVINMCIELIREFYTLPRQFRILGKYGIEEFVSYDNSGIQLQDQGTDFGEDMGFRLPVFDLEVTAQKESPYSKMAQNELALQFFQLGFFNPQLADQALACLEMMDFNHKDSIMQKIAENMTLSKENAMLKQQLLQMAQIVDQLQGTNMSEQLAMQITGQAGMQQQIPQKMSDKADIAETDTQGNLKEKNTIVENAKNRATQATQPN